MAERFLALMADLDDGTQERFAQWYAALKEAGFTGAQTPGLPYHISLAIFPPDREREAVLLARKAAESFSPIAVHISHIGVFAPGRVLFGAADFSAELAALHDACETNPAPPRPWTPHVTLLIDEPETVCCAMPVLLKNFSPLVGKITRLHLCAFRPMREVASFELNPTVGGAGRRE